MVHLWTGFVSVFGVSIDGKPYEAMFHRFEALNRNPYIKQVDNTAAMTWKTMA